MADTPASNVDPAELATLTESLAGLTQTYERTRETGPEPTPTPQDDPR
jgi:hypothetical protein